MKDYLPIGSVVILEKGEKPIMICGRKQIHTDTGESYDYAAYLYPEGKLTEDFNYLFNHEQIAELLFKGYVNEDEKELLALIEKVESENKTESEIEEELSKLIEEIVTKYGDEEFKKEVEI